MIDFSLYGGEVSFTDHHIGRLIEYLERSRIRDNTLIVLTADHGEHLGEHSFYGHSKLLYEPSLHIPMIISWPRKLSGGKRLENFIQLRDVAPTIADLAEVEVPEYSTGRNLSSLLYGRDPFRRTNEADSSAVSWTIGPNDVLTHSYRTDHCHFISGIARPDSLELFDMTRDPAQEINLLHDREGQDKAEIFHSTLSRLESSFQPVPVTKAIDMDQETRKGLKALGYIE
jgi:arylsulfatase A-like enzyme